MYSGDEFYGDEITSPLYQPIRPNTIDPLSKEREQPRAAPHSLSYEAWEAKLSTIVSRQAGCDLDDLPDFDTYSGWEDGYTPAAFFREVIMPELGV